MARVGTPTTADDAVFEIRFNPWREVTARTPNGSPVLLTSMSKAVGSFVSVDRDSLRMQLDSWRGEFPPADHELEPYTQVTFPTSDPGITFHRRRFSTVKTLLLAGSIVGLIALAIGQADLATPGDIGGGYTVLHFFH
jgi:hypothetical protein